MAGDYKDTLQQCLLADGVALRDDGLLILGTWSEQACATRHMLSIYKDHERQRLALWTPPVRELRQRLRQAGFEIVEAAQPDIRLDLTVCRLA